MASTKAIAGFVRTIGNIFRQAAIHGRNLGDVLSSIARQLASKALVNALAMLVSGGSFGIGKLLFGSVGSIIGVNDALVRSDGSVVQFHPDDDILAMKDFGNLQPSGGNQRIENHLYLDGRELEIALENARYQRTR